VQVPNEVAGQFDPASVDRVLDLRESDDLCPLPVIPASFLAGENVEVDDLVGGLGNNDLDQQLVEVAQLVRRPEVGVDDFDLSWPVVNEAAASRKRRFSPRVGGGIAAPLSCSPPPAGPCTSCATLAPRTQRGESAEERGHRRGSPQTALCCGCVLPTPA
jgi:hypothetical protein